MCQKFDNVRKAYASFVYTFCSRTTRTALFGKFIRRHYLYNNLFEFRKATELLSNNVSNRIRRYLLAIQTNLLAAQMSIIVFTYGYYISSGIIISSTVNCCNM